MTPSQSHRRNLILALTEQSEETLGGLHVTNMRQRIFIRERGMITAERNQVFFVPPGGGEVGQPKKTQQKHSRLCNPQNRIQKLYRHFFPQYSFPGFGGTQWSRKGILPSVRRYRPWKKPERNTSSLRSPLKNKSKSGLESRGGIKKGIKLVSPICPTARNVDKMFRPAHSGPVGKATGRTVPRQMCLEYSARPTRGQLARGRSAKMREGRLQILARRCSPRRK